MTEAQRTAIETLIADIAAWQDKGEKTDSEVAAELGIPRTTWVAARNKRFKPGLPLVQKIAQHPKFAKAARSILLAGAA